VRWIQFSENADGGVYLEGQCVQKLLPDNIDEAAGSLVNRLIDTVLATWQFLYGLPN
jgi:hypothetical protein